jgi:hypothetical protein
MSLADFILRCHSQPFLNTVSHFPTPSVICRHPKFWERIKKKSKEYERELRKKTSEDPVKREKFLLKRQV